MARPSLLTKERTKKIADLITAGNDAETSAMASGISKAAYYVWLARGRAEIDRLTRNPKLKAKASEQPYIEFVETIEQARAEAEARLVVLVSKAAADPKTWQAATWLLERREPKKWGRVNRTEITGADGGPVKSESTVQVSDTELKDLADRLTGLGPVIPKTD